MRAQGSGCAMGMADRTFVIGMGPGAWVSSSAVLVARWHARSLRSHEHGRPRPVFGPPPAGGSTRRRSLRSRRVAPAPDHVKRPSCRTPPSRSGSSVLVSSLVLGSWSSIELASRRPLTAAAGCGHPQATARPGVAREVGLARHTGLPVRNGLCRGARQRCRLTTRIRSTLSGTTLRGALARAVGTDHSSSGRRAGGSALAIVDRPL